MSRNESDREDLLREATALVERVELSIPSCSDPVVVGFRRDGAASVFFGGDPVYQFNSRGELRRAFVGGLLYKAVAAGLASLTRRRTPAETQLVRHDLTASETADFLVQAQAQLQSLSAALERSDYRVLGQVPAGGDVVSRAGQWLRELRGDIQVARTARVR